MIWHALAWFGISVAGAVAWWRLREGARRLDALEARARYRHPSRPRCQCGRFVTDEPWSHSTDLCQPMREEL